MEAGERLARHRLIDQLLSVPNCGRMSRLSEKSHGLLTKILRAVSEKSRIKLEKITRENFVKLGERNISDFQKKEASEMMPRIFPTIDEKDETHQMMMEIELPLIIEPGGTSC